MADSFTHRCLQHHNLQDQVCSFQSPLMRHGKAAWVVQYRWPPQQVTSLYEPIQLFQRSRRLVSFSGLGVPLDDGEGSWMPFHTLRLRPRPLGFVRTSSILSVFSLSEWTSALPKRAAAFTLSRSSRRASAASYAARSAISWSCLIWPPRAKSRNDRPASAGFRGFGSLSPEYSTPSRSPNAWYGLGAAAALSFFPSESFKA